MNNATKTDTKVTTWTLDPVHTLTGFSARHMMFTTVRGKFTDVEGSIRIDEENPDASSVEVRIDAESIDTGVQQRDDHLRSGDFLDVEDHPEITFASREVRGAAKKKGDRFEVVGDLSIRGTTREVTLDAVYGGRGQDPWGGTRAGFSASTTIDRRDFGLTWNQMLEAGGVLVGNDVKIEIEAQATLDD